MTGVAAAGVVTVAVCAVKTAVLSRMSFADGRVVPPAAKLTFPEGAPALADWAGPGVCANCAVSTVWPEVETGVGVARMVPVLAAREATVRVIAGVGEVQTVLVPPEPPGNESQMLNEAVVPTGAEEENAAGTATSAKGAGTVRGALPNDPKVIVVVPPLAPL